MRENRMYGLMRGSRETDREIRNCALVLLYKD